MKKIIIGAIILATSAVTANAQTGSVLVGGNVDISSTKIPGTLNDQKTTQVLFSPTVGYQFTDNWTAGITGSIFSNKSTQGSNISKYTGFNAGPFVRYSKSLSNMFALYGQLQGTFGDAKNTYTSGSISTTSKSSTTAIQLFPAVFINLKNSFGLNFNIGGLSYISTKPSGGSSSNTFDFNFGKVASIGVSKNFGGK